MKTSRDKAREHLNNPSYDKNIQRQLTAIKDTGANYVAIDTPYDEEFLPYLKRWVILARKSELKVWFRGNWSRWEGWFGYPKNMSPAEHLIETSQFIQNNPDIFEDGDIFDSCPECENAEHWEQPEENDQYNKFLQNQQESNEKAFEQIGKNVYSNIPSIIGGRAREVLSKETLRSLDNVVAIDHYISNPSNMGEYVDYFFKENNTQVVVSELGAPIPDIHGNMTDDEQAEHVNELLNQLYTRGDAVIGVNYYVLTLGTTALLNDDFSPRKSYSVVKNYFSPTTVTGRVTNSLGDKLQNITVKSESGPHDTKTDKEGNYSFKVPPPRELTVKAGGEDYVVQSHELTVKSSGSEIRKDFILEPKNANIFYRLRLFLQNIQNSLFN